jgi:hypothetical protein
LLKGRGAARRASFEKSDQRVEILERIQESDAALNEQAGRRVFGLAQRLLYTSDQADQVNGVKETCITIDLGPSLDLVNLIGIDSD